MGAKKQFQSSKKGKPKGKPLVKKNKKSQAKAAKPLNRKNKVHIKFDAADRKDYLKGFQKRKQQRREQAQQKIAEDLRNEMKKIRSDRREMMKKMIYEGYNVPEDEEENENENVTITNYGSATVEISEMDLTSKLHPESSKVVLEGEDSNASQNKTKPNGEINASDDIPTYTKGKLEDLGIFSKKDLQRSWRQSAARTVKRNKLMQRRETRHAREQRQGQRKSYNKKKRNKLKKSKSSRGKK